MRVKSACEEEKGENDGGRGSEKGGNEKNEEEKERERVFDEVFILGCSINHCRTIIVSLLGFLVYFYKLQSSTCILQL